VKKQLTIVIDVHDNGSSWATIDPPEDRRPTIGVHRHRYTSDAKLVEAIAAALHNNGSTQARAPFTDRGSRCGRNRVSSPARQLRRLRTCL
jgi:hypothetical protein